MSAERTIDDVECEYKESGCMAYDECFDALVALGETKNSAADLLGQWEDEYIEEQEELESDEEESEDAGE